MEAEKYRTACKVFSIERTQVSKNKDVAGGRASRKGSWQDGRYIPLAKESLSKEVLFYEDCQCKKERETLTLILKDNPLPACKKGRQKEMPKG